MTTPESTVRTDEVVVALDDPANRYDILLGEARIGRLDYRRHGDVLDLHHTEIDPAFEGRGLGARLVHDALDDIRERGLTVRPQCSFVRVFIQRNPAYADLVAT